jgi:hypothetical protein
MITVGRLCGSLTLYKNFKTLLYSSTLKTRLLVVWTRTQDVAFTRRTERGDVSRSPARREFQLVPFLPSCCFQVVSRYGSHSLDFASVQNVVFRNVSGFGCHTFDSHKVKETLFNFYIQNRIHIILQFSRMNHVKQSISTHFRRISTVTSPEHPPEEATLRLHNNSSENESER